MMAATSSGSRTIRLPTIRHAPRSLASLRTFRTDHPMWPASVSGVMVSGNVIPRTLCASLMRSLEIPVRDLGARDAEFAPHLHNRITIIERHHWIVAFGAKLFE
jgi:hypothetical protein